MTPSASACIRLLLVEDRPDDAELLLREVRRAGFDLDAVHADSRDAFLHQLECHPDLILADYSLPQFGALDLLDILRERGLDTPVIVVSGAMSEEEAVECMRRGAADYLIKDRLGRLGFAIRRALADGEVRAERRLAEAQRIQLAYEQAARAREQERSNRLHGLAEASVAISATLSVGGLLEEITRRARQLIGAHVALTVITGGMVEGREPGRERQSASSLSEAYAGWRGRPVRLAATQQVQVVCAENRPRRLTRADVAAWSDESDEPDDGGADTLPLRGWLAAPLVARGGRNVGLIQLSDKLADADFTEDDEAVLVQLARLASVALENAALYQQAQDAVRARDEFLSIASHEFRNPIAGIKGTAQLCRRFHQQGRLDRERLGRYLDTIESTSSRLAILTEDLLDVSQLQRGQLMLRPRPTDLAGLVATAVERQQVHTDRHTFALHLPPASREPRELVLDPDRVEQILTNLLDNSVKYSPDGGCIRVTLTTGPTGALLTVQDTGIGLPDGSAERIFQPFGRAENVAERHLPGLGLGLYICRRIAEQHGGRLWAESAGEGRGTTFSLWLPADAGDSALPDVPAAVPTGARTRALMAGPVDD